MTRLRRGNPALIRDLNRAAIFRLIGQEGPIARADIARRLDLSPAAVTGITRDLVRDGLVDEVEAGPSSGGRPPILLGLSVAAGYVIGAKIAADHLSMVWARLDGDVIDRRIVPFEAAAEGALDRLVEHLAAAVVDAGTGAGRLLGIGLGVPGIADADGIVDAPIVGWRGVPVGELLRDRLHVPVLVDNDVNTLAAAERLYGRGRGVDDFVTVTIGRGVGLGIIAAGELYRGGRGGAGELGHVPVDPDGPRCTCGNVGCLEALVGDPALATQAVAAGIASPDADDVVAQLRTAAADGDPRALAIYARAGGVLGRAVAGIVNILAPQLVLVSGEGTQAWSHLADAFADAFRRGTFPPLRGVPVEVDPWDDTKWALGAAALVLRVMFASPLYERELEDAVRDRLGARPGAAAGDAAGATVAERRAAGALIGGAR